MLKLDDIKQMAHGAGLSSSDLRVKQLAKAAYDLGCQHTREKCAVWLEKECEEQYLADRIRSQGDHK